MVGIATGLAWSLLAGYARRLVIHNCKVALWRWPCSASLWHLPGRTAGCLARQAAGMALRIPATLSGLSLLLMAWIYLKVPDYPGQRSDQRLPLRKVLQTPGVRPVLAVVMLWILAHYTLYTYIAAFLASVGLADQVDRGLLYSAVWRPCSVYG